MKNRSYLLKQIQQFNFAMIEVAMYLDNQPENQNALALYDKVRVSYINVKNEYEQQYGPLTPSGVNAVKDGWTWLDGPWPWEGEY